MANPEFKEDLDALDKLSVCLYRLGISLFSIGCLLAAALSYEGITLASVTSPFDQWIFWMLLTSTVLAAANIHVYDKTVRTVIMWSGWLALLFVVTDLPTWVSLGFCFVVFSGIALKESFCFRVPGLKLIPVLLVIAVLCTALNKLPVLVALYIAVGGIMGFLSFKKWQMPLHFDIGIKANYQI
ncbi:DUF2301 domain-containing membrane protein [Vibrio mediterranei]|jgi:uncharacterized integral membrane protein|uniref:Uncharacterized protein n=1 Tax=Vibrio mediterranei TaxID=689 RepID=A0ABX5D6F6_9VIBR|nr:DUF2301 domain-containing membrane protein [Vibrio mediterranei]MCG9660981.1 DUF2301 domain-containing membrane protein [Vibrio mediterranei]MCG9664870.1 DUF2301 domain-containing membrane protein [Vibrio mediterranei]PCD89726.1 hypothetical protein COR52_00270 [Vibrio mediterranei]PRQ65055.1 hypothetical protein COR51_24020 [Vibrio mediterranei]SBO11437.1 hypothetical protein VME0621_03573 [Vibrio mediterranei]